MNPIKVLLVTVCLMMSIKSGCLRKDALVQLGLEPLDTPVRVDKPSVCKNTLADNLICVSEKQLEERLKKSQDENLKRSAHAYVELSKVIDNVIRNYNKLQEDVKDKTTYNGKTITEETRKAILEANAFMPKDEEAYQETVKDNTDLCLLIQSKLTVGSLCTLSADNASNYVNFGNGSEKEVTKDESKKVDNSEEVNTTDGNDSNSARRLAETATKRIGFNLSVEENAATDVYTACQPYIRAACIYRLVGRVIDGLNYQPLRHRGGCYSDVMDCETNPSNCPLKARTLIFTHLFAPLSNRLVNRVELEAVNDYLTDNYGTNWEKIKEGADDIRDKTVEVVDSGTAAVKDGYDSLTGSGDNDQNTASTETNANRVLSRKVRMLKSVSSSDSDENLNEDVKYKTSSHGRDIVKEGDLSGVEIRSTSIMPVLFGIITLCIQLVL